MASALHVSSSVNPYSIDRFGRIGAALFLSTFVAVPARAAISAPPAPSWHLRAADSQPAAAACTAPAAEHNASLIIAPTLADIITPTVAGVDAGAPGTAAFAAAQADEQPLHAAAVEHSDAYHTRAKIHKIASFATLPLFAAEVALGQSLYNSTNGGTTRGSTGAHVAVGTGIIGLFAVNTITGAWNLFGEDRQEHSGRALRLVHGLLMMAADAGFVATSATGPGGGHRGLAVATTSASTHRAIALSSIGVGTAGYLIMLLGHH